MDKEMTAQTRKGECPACGGRSLIVQNELWFGTFEHTERKCHFCSWYSYR